MENNVKGHLAAIVTVIIWASTFISTKVLLSSFLPIEILFIRFLLGLAVLLIVSPKFLPFSSWRQEGYFALAGIFGVFLYYYLENVALTYTLAMNVGIIGSISPFVTALLSRFLLKEGKLKPLFILGFFCSIIGICFISLTGTLNVNPIGDGLAFIATFFWAGYSLVIKKIGQFGYSTIAITQRIFIYGLLLMTPVFLYSIDGFDWARFADIKNMGNLLFLGVGASALCFVTWNFSVRQLGAVRAAIYIYSIPMLTTLASVILLGEQLTIKAGIGILLTLSGLFLSEWPNIAAQRRMKVKSR
ncbi:DMT family transporter [Candidatus Enterococcus ferrettii]|uniref:EamA domain-containing protein n=1 Tax=Candidatus Enterococcus ferrettii TaxID=2815324 RepID=A0ABV0EQE7_9ENTE|nr:DMT family transporter [Enterococcus sp. 665A]MBO1340957.1 DMT family transporter [Enterococcus sp. 665A]